ncbi:hypothetical protein VTN96DRAFT_2928 [Rasamsonia emersonii]
MKGGKRRCEDKVISQNIVSSEPRSCRIEKRERTGREVEKKRKREKLTGANARRRDGDQAARSQTGPAELIASNLVNFFTTPALAPSPNSPSSYPTNPCENPFFLHHSYSPLKTLLFRPLNFLFLSFLLGIEFRPGRDFVLHRFSLEVFLCFRSPPGTESVRQNEPLLRPSCRSLLIRPVQTFVGRSLRTSDDQKVRRLVLVPSLPSPYRKF